MSHEIQSSTTPSWEESIWVWITVVECRYCTGDAGFSAGSGPGKVAICVDASAHLTAGDTESLWLSVNGCESLCIYSQAPLSQVCVLVKVGVTCKCMIVFFWVKGGGCYSGSSIPCLLCGPWATHLPQSASALPSPECTIRYTRRSHISSQLAVDLASLHVSPKSD